MYTVQNKVLPGAYINFVSAARASATLGDRGTAAFPLSLDWGPENEVVTIENSEFQKGSLALTGYAYTADELRPLREIFANAKTLHLFRLNSGGAKAACKYAEAKYPGKIGNELKIVIQQNEGFTVSTNEVYDVSTYIGTTLVDTQKAVKAVSDLSDNDYLHWKGSEALTENAGLLLTGGGSLLRGLDTLLAQRTGMEAHVAAAPIQSVALGLLETLPDLSKRKEGVLYLARRQWSL